MRLVTLTSPTEKRLRLEGGSATSNRFEAFTDYILLFGMDAVPPRMPSSDPSVAPVQSVS